MAVKITAQIGTDKGITSEAYVRIADYQVSKYGYANLRLEIFQSAADAAPEGANPMMSVAGQARNQQIGDSLSIPLVKQVENEEEGPIVIVPDLSSVEDKNVFEFGYGKLKEKLVSLFGADHVVDC